MLRPTAEDYSGYSDEIEEDEDPNSDEARGVDPDWRWENRWDD